MEDAKILVYDGTFNGFLTAVFVAFEEKIQVSAIQKNRPLQGGLFSEGRTIFTAIDKAKRVWSGIQRKSDVAVKNMYFAFLSEAPGIEFLIYRYIKKLFSFEEQTHMNFSTTIAARVHQIAKSVSKEKYHVESFLQFKRDENNLFRAIICPENDILPLLSKHFRSQFAKQKWLIYDSKRKYGLYYDLHTVTRVLSENTPVYLTKGAPVVRPILTEKLSA